MVRFSDTGGAADSACGAWGRAGPQVRSVVRTVADGDAGSSSSAVCAVWCRLSDVVSGGDIYQFPDTGTEAVYSRGNGGDAGGAGWNDSVYCLYFQLYPAAFAAVQYSRHLPALHRGSRGTGGPADIRGRGNTGDSRRGVLRHRTDDDLLQQTAVAAGTVFHRCRVAASGAGRGDLSVRIVLCFRNMFCPAESQRQKFSADGGRVHSGGFTDLRGRGSDAF